LIPERWDAELADRDREPGLLVRTDTAMLVRILENLVSSRSSLPVTAFPRSA